MSYPILILVFVFGDWYGVDNSLAKSFYKEWGLLV
jgi:hypothetical protein